MNKTLRRLLIGIAAAMPVSALAAIVINFPNFSNCTGLQLNANAACTANVLRVTPATFSQAGTAFSQTAIPLGPGNTFSTFFSFQMTSPGGAADGDGLGADGLTFTVQPNASTAGGGGGGIGYQGIANSVAIEFDTWANGSPTDPDGNHVGVDVNGSVVSVVTVPIATRMNDGNVWYAWVDYNGSVLELRLSQTNSRPAVATMSHAVNLQSILGTNQAFVGFTSGTGAAYENHDVLSWVFDNAYAPIGGPPSAGPAVVPTMSHIALALVALMLAAFAALRLRRP